MLPVVRARLRSLDPELFLSEVVELPDLRSASVLDERFPVVVLAAFTLVALSLSFVGVFGVVAASVGRRTREMAVRQALGADGRGVLSLVVGETLRLIAAGTAVGVGAAIASSGLLESLLFGVSPTDVATLATVAASVVAVGAVVALAAAMRVLRLEPAAALRRP